MSKKRKRNSEQLEQSLSIRRERFKRVINRIGQHDYLPHIDRNKRLYTPIVQMPEPVRHFLTYKGQPLASLDVINSQPVHFRHLLSNQFWQEKALRITLHSIRPEIYNEMKESGQLQSIREHITENGDSEDVWRYIEETTDGTFYEHLVDRYGEKYSCFQDRSSAKKEFMRFMNFKTSNKDQASYANYRDWASDFPGIAGLLELIKEKDHTLLSSILQALEAKMLLRRVTQEFVQMNPQTPILSVHDSLITLKEKVDELTTVLKHVYQQELNFIPKLKTKVLCEENAQKELAGYVARKFQQLLAVRRDR